MRTIIAIDDDLSILTKGLAREQGCSLGTVVSMPVRKAVSPEAPASSLNNGGHVSWPDDRSLLADRNVLAHVS